MEQIEKIPKYDEKIVAEFINENSFLDAYVELDKHVIRLLWQILDLKYCDDAGNPKVIKRDDAIMGGNLLRLIKLNLSFLQNICEGKLEICNILNRCIAETVINLKYMLIEGGEQVRRNYIKNSLITEKELWETIKSNVSERGGDTLDIEVRMKNSIKESFENSDFELEEINRSSSWKTLKSRANIVAGEMFYSVYYGISSHAIHGNWQDILSNNLEKVEGGFKLDTNWQKPKSQIMDGPIILNIGFVLLFIQKELSNNPFAHILTENGNTLLDYQSVLMQYHEKWKLSRSKNK